MSCSKRNSKKVKCSLKGNAPNVKSLRELVKHYKKHHQLDLDWRDNLSIIEAVFGDNNYNSEIEPLQTIPTDLKWDNFQANPHQARHYSKEELKEIAISLAANWNRTSFKDFDDLYDYVHSILVISSINPNGKVQNPRALIIYDIALRLARRFGVWPKKYVYLNGIGPFKGAKALCLGKYIKYRRILYSDIIKYYPELKELDAAELENFLCWYFKQLNLFNRI